MRLSMLHAPRKEAGTVAGVAGTVPQVMHPAVVGVGEGNTREVAVGQVKTVRLCNLVNEQWVVATDRESKAP